MQNKSVVCIGGCMDGLIIEDKGHKYLPVSRIDQRDFFSELSLQEQMDIPSPTEEYELISGGKDFDYYVLAGDVILMNSYIDQCKRAVKK